MSVRSLRNERRVSAQGTGLGKQVAEILLVERDVDIRDFDILNLSRDFESSFVVNELDPTLWFNIVRDESEIKYATTQIALDYKDLQDAIGGDPVEVAVANPEKQRKIKHEVLDIFTMPTCCACAAGDFSAVRAGSSAMGAASSAFDRSMRSRPMPGRIRNGSTDRSRC